MGTGDGLGAPLLDPSESEKHPAIIYAMVARLSGKTREILCEAAVKNQSKSSGQVLQSLLDKIDFQPHQPMMFQHGKYGICCKYTPPNVYMAVVEDAYPTAHRFAFLKNIEELFVAQFPHQPSPSECVSFCATLKSQGVQYTNDPPISAKRKELEAKMAENKQIMISNIEAVLDRRDIIDVVVDKTEELKQSSKQFHQGATRIKRLSQWKNIKFWIIITLVVLVLLVILLLVFCKPNFSNCK
jgi:hypothetical protein